MRNLLLAAVAAATLTACPETRVDTDHADGLNTETAQQIQGLAVQYSEQCMVAIKGTHECGSDTYESNPVLAQSAKKHEEDCIKENESVREAAAKMLVLEVQANTIASDAGCQPRFEWSCLKDHIVTDTSVVDHWGTADCNN